jgi:hypothetical protein
MKKLLALLLLIPGIVFAQQESIIAASPLIEGTTGKVRILTDSTQRIELLTNINGTSKGFYIDGSTGNLTSVGGATVPAGPTDITFTSLIGSGASPKIISGSSSILFRSNTDAATILTLSNAGNLTFGAAAAKIIPGATSLTFRNNGDSADNIAITDAGTISTRNTIIFTNDTQADIANSTTSQAVHIGGGTDYNASTGAVISVNGNAAGGGNAGGIVMNTGTASGGSAGVRINNGTGTFYVFDGSTSIISAAVGGAITLTGTLASTRTTDFGWTRVNAANQACNTTCTNACVIGIDTLGTGGFLLCTDATADSCICAGAS